MCGVAGFLSGLGWVRDGGLGWLGPVAAGLEAAAPGDAAAADRAVDALAARFAELMSFATHLAVATDPSARAALQAVAARLDLLAGALAEGPGAREPAAERAVERLRDYAWQVGHEVLAGATRVLALMPDPAGASRAAHMAAFALAQVLENLDRLEVRGRDSAGVAVQLELPPGVVDVAALRARIIELGRGGLDRDLSVSAHALPGGGATARFSYKTAQLVGSLGDNGAALRAKLRGDALFWELAGAMRRVSALAHTRWASHGAISLDNCHPLNGRLAGDNGPWLDPDADAVAVLNGDVDNYRAIREGLVEAAGHRLPAETTTDLKAIPACFRLQAAGTPVPARFLAALRRLEGSVAVGLLHPAEPGRLYLGQRGSGQSLFVAETADGLCVASENYGLAPRARASVALARVERGGLCVTLSTEGGDPALAAVAVDDGAATELKAEPIAIFSRDIFRGRFAHFFEKEVHEGPQSVRKTLAGRYRRQGRAVLFEAGVWGPLRERCADPSRPGLRRVFVTGQGTAAVAGMGVAHLLRQALGEQVRVEAAKASELSADLEGRDLTDALVIAISQSGTTTDTNRTVDLARAAGAFVHAIVNRRNSPLAMKSDSTLFTSDGRDIEMAVASTKAFYAQVAAGKLTALCLADALGTLPPAQVHDELVALEGLPARIQEVLDGEAEVAAVAERYAPYARHWAVVGNGANKVAAEEVRIKLSELCYKSIPVDFTEDKKHIDLSTEPLTLVIANDLPAALAQDTAKEVAIFKAHAGSPIVIAAKGEGCFDAYAEAVIKVPSAGAGLDMVLATVAGHLFGFHAAKAIDRQSGPFRELGAALEAALVSGTRELSAPAGLARGALARVSHGMMDACLPPRAVAKLAALEGALREPPADPVALRGALEGGVVLARQLAEETSRPVDTIRHQAKTVTVGISRPGREVAPSLAQALAGLGLSLAGLAARDRDWLLALSPVVTGVPSAMLYAAAGDGPDGLPLLRATARVGAAAGVASGYDNPRPPAGSKRRALRLGRAVLSAGPHGTENLLLLPVPGQAGAPAAGLALVHLELAAQAPLQQKVALLRGLNLYDDLVDAYNEAVHGDRRDALAFIADLSPRALLFRTPQDLLRDL
ncbi:SIS domain-containing protein [Aerophototrophica crusticola]|uniref:SIS domain-containing protein n=1 Tax=Aerophototrophica crusticola TaxID=1709002 RepID=UPI00384E3385